MKLPALAALGLILSIPALSRADVPRIVDIRVGQHQGHERVVIELERRADARWYVTPDGLLVLDFAARPLLSEQELTPGRERIESMLLTSTPQGARLSIDAGEHRARAFELTDPARLVLDVADPGPGALALPAGVRSVPRCHGNCGPRPFAPAAPPRPALPDSAQAAGASAPEPAEETGNAAGPAPGVPQAAGPEPAPRDQDASGDGAVDLDGLERAADVAALEVAPPPAPRRVLSRALWVPLLVGAGLLLIAMGGLSLAGVQRRLPRIAPAGDVPELEPPAPGDVDRMALLERRLEEELSARRLLEGQLAHAAREIAGLRTRPPRSDAVARERDAD